MMMTAAVYARKSTDQHDVADQEKSVTRQLEQAKVYAMKHGWTVAEEHCYVDDGVSGAEFAKRPGLVALLNALKPRPPFGVLLIYDADRLGREATETGFVMKKIAQAGVRIVETKGPGRELLFDSPADRMMMAMMAGVAELERDKARTRPRDALQRKAERGYVTGGRVFGYDNVVVTDAQGRRSHVVRRVNEAEAAVVRQIFQLYVDGHGLQKIARRLNDERSPAPKPKRVTLPRGWAPSSVREVLYRDLYHGVNVWGKTKKRNQWGQKHQQPREASTWVRHQDDTLRIVPDDLWEAVHQRLDGIRQNYLRWTGGKLWGRPASGTESKYLLTGLGTCARCGGGVAVEQRTHGRRTRAHFYGCWAHRSRGPAPCTNGLLVPLAVADDGILSAFESQLLHRDAIALGLRATLAALQTPPEAGAGDIAAQELETVEAQLSNLTQAIKLGGSCPRW